MKVTGTATGKLTVAPNPMRPTARRVAPGKFSIQHNPDAVDWVLSDKGGTLLRFKIALPEKGLLRVDGKCSIYDCAGNRVASDPVSDMKLSNIFSKADRVYRNELRNNVLPASWPRDGSIYDYTIYWNGCTLGGAPASPGVYRVSLQLVITTEGGKETKWYSQMIGVTHDE